MTLDRTQAPLTPRRSHSGGAPSSGFSFPDFQRQRIDAGLEIYTARWGSAPLVSLEFLLPGGGQCTPLDSPGLASLAASLLDEGTRSRTGQEIAARIEELGGGLASGADWDTSSVSASCLGKDLETALDLAIDVATEPVFPIEAVVRVAAQRRAEILRRRSTPGFLADRLLLAAVYAGTPYAEALIGTPEGIAVSTRERIERFYDERIAGPIQVIAVGDLDPEDLLAVVTQRLAGHGRSAPPPAPAIVLPAKPASIRVLIVDRPAGAQTELRLGHVGVPRRYPERPSLAVMSSLLGGKFTSRINLNLRERHGYTYGARLGFSSRRGPGPFTVSAAVETPAAGAATREVLSELHRIRDEQVSNQELEETVGYLLGVFPYTLQQAGGVATRLAQIAIHDLPQDHYHRLPERLRAVTAESIQRTARDTIHPEALTVVAVGPAKEVAPQFADFESVEIVKA